MKDTTEDAIAIREYKSLIEALKEVAEYEKLDEQQQQRFDKEIDTLPIDCDELRVHIKKTLDSKKANKVIKRSKLIMREKYVAEEVGEIDDDVKAILTNPDLYELIDVELNKKIEGEHKARKTIFITTNMRNVANLNKATDNLNINDIGGTGKDHTASAVYDILPDNEKVKRTRITPKVLAYLNDIKSCPNGWIKKCLYLEDIPNDVLNDDCFKVMSSADPNGITQTSIVLNNSLKDIDIRGKPSIIITIATANPRQELLRRYPICNLTSTIDQTKAILRKQAKFAMDGTSPEYDQNIKRALAYLKRVKVKIPYADKIAGVFPAGNVIIRTHFPRFLDYIKSSCALYQYQREQDEEGNYLATEQDYNIARDVIASTTSNVLMIPLTKLQKDILEVFGNLSREAYTIQELEPKMSHLGIADRWLRIQLEKLAGHGFLVRNNEKRDYSMKPVAVYAYSDIVKLELPEFSDLSKVSANNALYTNSANCTNNSNSEGYLNNLHYLNSELDPKTLKKTDLIHHKCSTCGSSPSCWFNDKTSKYYCDVCKSALEVQEEIIK